MAWCVHTSVLSDFCAIVTKEKITPPISTTIHRSILFVFSDKFYVRVLFQMQSFHRNTHNLMRSLNLNYCYKTKYLLAFNLSNFYLTDCKLI